MVGTASVNDQSVTGVLTTSPRSQSPGVLHVQDAPALGQSRGSKPVARSETSSTTRTTTTDPPIRTSFFIKPPAKCVGSYTALTPAASVNRTRTLRDWRVFRLCAAAFRRLSTVSSKELALHRSEKRAGLRR